MQEPCRVWADLVAGGIKPENIIMMAYSSNVNSEQNPYPGKMFTDPSETIDGDWAKSGCYEHIDYTGGDINEDVFIGILSGDANKVRERTGIENPKVLAGGPDDTVFTYFIDHGGDDVIMVGRDFIHSGALIDAFRKAHEKKLYGKWVWFMEACYSGSMFTRLPDFYDIFVMTSADAHHEADMSNCPPNDVVGGKSLNTCLSGLWDNSFLDYLEAHPDCTIGEIVDAVHEDVAKTSQQNVSQWGDMTFRDLKLADFVGTPSTHSQKKTSQMTVAVSEVPAHLAKWKAIRAEDSAAMMEYQEVVFAEAKKEVEIMRLGVVLMGEKKAEKAMKMVAENYSIDCVRDLTMNLVKQCNHSLPLSSPASNLLRNICSNSTTAPEVDFSEICL